MRGKITVANNKHDIKLANVTDEQIINMATQKVTYDDAKYPADYDKNLKPNGAGFIEPIPRVETEIDHGVLQRFGVSLDNTTLSKAVK